MKLNISLTQMKYVLAVDEHKSFQKAAEVCHVTQPTLSMQIQKLEDQLEMSVFDRSKKPIETTPSGHQMIIQMRKVLREAEQLEFLLESEKSLIRGPFKLGIIPTIAPYLLPRFATAVADSYPELELTIEELQTEQIIQALESSRLDAAILATPLHNKGLTEDLLYYENFVFYGHTRHPLHERKSIKKKDLTSNDVWLLNQGHCFRDQVLDLCHSSRSKDSKYSNLIFESGNLETLRKFVDKGVGYTLLPRLALPDQLSKWPKQAKAISQPEPVREVSLVFLKSFFKAGIVEAIKEEILKALPKDINKKAMKKAYVVPINPAY